MPHSRSGRPVEILLVEDNPGDVHLTLEALSQARIKNKVEVVNDGEAALRYLRRTHDYLDAVRPDLVVLDLNLPRRDGHEVLNEIREDENLSTLPVIVLTSSERDMDVSRSYGLRANCYITKPVGADEFVKVVQSISDFWFEIVTLPELS